MGCLIIFIYYHEIFTWNVFAVFCEGTNKSWRNGLYQNLDAFDEGFL